MCSTAPTIEARIAAHLVAVVVTEFRRADVGVGSIVAGGSTVAEGSVDAGSLDAGSLDGTLSSNTGASFVRDTASALATGAA